MRHLKQIDEGLDKLSQDIFGVHTIIRIENFPLGKQFSFKLSDELFQYLQNNGYNPTELEGWASKIQIEGANVSMEEVVSHMAPFKPEIPRNEGWVLDLVQEDDPNNTAEFRWHPTEGFFLGRPLRDPINENMSDFTQEIFGLYTDVLMDIDIVALHFNGKDRNIKEGFCELFKNKGLDCRCISDKVIHSGKNTWVFRIEGADLDLEDIMSYVPILVAEEAPEAKINARIYQDDRINDWYYLMWHPEHGYYDITEWENMKDDPEYDTKEVIMARRKENRKKKRS